MWCRSLFGIVVTVAVAAPRAQDSGDREQSAWSYESVALRDGARLEVAVVRPAGFKRSTPYPVLLALPPGAQTRAMVEAGMSRYWGAQARARGWVVVSPVAPSGSTFVHGAERHLPGLLRWMRIQFTVEGNRFHLAGASHGGRSAFRVATQHAWEFQSMTVLPGTPLTDQDRARLGALRRVDVRMFVGGDDAEWLDATRSTVARLREHGVSVAERVFAGEGHVPPSLDGTVVIDHLESLRVRVDPSAERAPVDAMLDDFHDAAAKADAARYFGAFTRDGVFMGTDATERWTVPEFRTWAKRAFERDAAWIFAPLVRHVAFGAGGDVAWFDEELGNASFGDCRGTGVCVRVNGSWKVAHYNLTVPVPNELVYGLVGRIRAFQDPATTAAETTVYIVRHAEKGGGADPELSDAGRARAEALARCLSDVAVSAVFSSAYRRTRQTAGPVAKSAGVEIAEYQAGQPRRMVETIRRDHHGGTVLIVGHSNTVPALVAAFGPSEPIEIGHSDYDDLFVVTIAAGGGTTMRHLHYGDPDPR